MIPQEIIDQILDTLDIVDVVSEYIQLKKAGRNFKASCPFHSEKTASFVVSPEKQIYHCFGCSAGGNALGFIMNYENITFPEAVEMAARKVGVELPANKRVSKQEQTLTERLYLVNKHAAAFYHNYLKSEKGKKGLTYLKKRGFTDEILKEFSVGYAPDEWEAFKKYCVEKKIPAELLKKAGLTISSEKGRGDYDRFRNRIMFPIFNERGNVVGFGGRVLDDSLPKYINSPETAIYTKSNVLYGLNFCKRGIREKGYVIISEGYMDVAIPFQFGVNNIVAASGTALTSRQAAMLKKYTDTAVMVFDADKAGEAASLRGLDVLIENGMKVRIVTLSEGDDPDSFIRKNGKEKFFDFLNNAKDLFDYKLDLLIKKLGADDIGGISDEMLPTITRAQNAVVQSKYIKILAERLGVHEASLRQEMGKVKKDYSYHSEEDESGTDKRSVNYQKSEVHLLGLAITDRRAFERIRTELGFDKFRDKNVNFVLRLVEDFYAGGHKDISPGKMLSRLEGNEAAKNAVLQAVVNADITKDVGKALKDCISCVRKENREEEIKVLTQRLKKAQTEKNDKEMTEILLKMNRIHKEKVV
ncbi:MAG: DNA primase [Candidatus Omnitrophica bacterium]|nr:DNA primase [Candidatus Omnitrophota bacterium]